MIPTTLICIIALVYVLWFVVIPWAGRYMRRRFERKVNDMFRQAMGGGASDPFGTYGQRQQQPPRQRAPKRKIFSRDEGEYVEFEEVHVRETSSTGSASSGQRAGYTPREPQVSDAEWEDI